MAKPATNTRETAPKNAAPLVPAVTDLRGEMYFLLGTAGYECDVRKANRMMEIFTILTAPAATTNGTSEAE